MHKGSKASNNVQDIQLRARTGMRVGEVQQEAHNSFCLALLCEEQGNNHGSIPHFERFYYCAKLLEDREGQEIALNRISIAFFMQMKL